MRNRQRDAARATRSEYRFDYTTGTRGRYFHRLMRNGATVSDGTALVVLEPDVARAFRDAAAVNKALRSLMTHSVPARRAPARTALQGTAARGKKVRAKAGPSA